MSPVLTTQTPAPSVLSHQSSADGLDRAGTEADPAFEHATREPHPAAQNPQRATDKHATRIPKHVTPIPQLAARSAQPETRNSFLFQITLMPFFERLNFGNQLFLLLRCQRLVKLSQADHNEINNFIHLRSVRGD